MNLYDALKTVPRDKQEYFKWKFPDVRFDQTKEEKTEEEFLKSVGLTTMNGFYRWEKSPEYKALVALYLQSRTANDLYDIYNEVSDMAKTGDDKAVKLFLSLSKEINEHAKQAVKVLAVQDEDEEVENDDGLVL
jgi:hypothetical protein